MLKKGFTLQELLITIGIIGIVAAITAPAIQKIVPNDKKAKFLKAYNTVTTVTNDIVSDDTLYWDEYDDDGNFLCGGLICDLGACCSGPRFVKLMTTHPELEKNGGIFTKATVGNVTDITKYNAWIKPVPYCEMAKFAILFASKLNLQTYPVCTANSDSGHDCSFTTTDGYGWTISSKKILVKNDQYEYIHEIKVDIDPNIEEENNTFKDAMENDKPKKTDQFKFNIDNNGNISIPAEEYLSLEFLKSPTDMQDKRNSLEKAKKAYKLKKEEEKPKE